MSFGGFGGGAPPPRDILILLGVIFVTFSMQFFDVTAGLLAWLRRQPLTVFVQGNRSRSLWTPSLGPGIGQDRPSYAPGYGPDNAVLGRVDQWFDPNAFVLQPAGTFGDTGRGDFIGPNLRTLDVALTIDVRVTGCGQLKACIVAP